MNPPKSKRSIQPQKMQRRVFLRGAFAGLGVSVGLPVFDMMLNNNGDALAQGGTLPIRFGVFYWGGGISVPYWTPPTTGTTWTSESLSPFDGIKPYVTVLTGFRHSYSSPGHIPARGIALSSSHDLTVCQGSCVGTYRGQNMPEPSLDALVVESWKGQAKFDLVAIGISRLGPYSSNSSWNRGGTTYNRHEPSPAALYNRLFSAGVPNRPMPIIETTTAFEKSMLDAVIGDANTLKLKLGSSDKLRLESHLEGLRSLEARLQLREKMPALSLAACSQPGAPPSKNFGDGSTHEEKEAKSQLMSELLASALACDLTRVFSYEWSATQSQAYYWEVGSNEEQHEFNHREPQTANYAKTITFTMKNFAYLAQKLKEKPEGGGNVLDRTLIFGTSEHGTAGFHDWNNHPLLLVGKAGGKIKSGIHHRDLNGLAPQVMLTAVRAVGVDVPKLGQAGGTGIRVATTTVSAIEA